MQVLFAMFLVSLLVGYYSYWYGRRHEEERWLDAAESHGRAVIYIGDKAMFVLDQTDIDRLVNNTIAHERNTAIGLLNTLMDHTKITRDRVDMN